MQELATEKKSSADLFKQLQAPFAPDEIRWRLINANNRKGQNKRYPPNSRGNFAPYLPAESLQRRLDTVLGPENWKDDYAPGPAGGIQCELSIRTNGEWITRVDGADIKKSKNENTDDVKSAYTQAFRRAGKKWGMGRELVRAAVWADIDEYGNYKKRPVLGGGRRSSSSTKRSQTSQASKKADPPKSNAAPDPGVAVARKMSAMGIKNRESAMMIASYLVGREIKTRKELTASEIPHLMSLLESIRVAAGNKVLDFVGWCVSAGVAITNKAEIADAWDNGFYVQFRREEDAKKKKSMAPGEQSEALYGQNSELFE